MTMHAHGLPKSCPRPDGELFGQSGKEMFERTTAHDSRFDVPEEKSSGASEEECPDCGYPLVVKKQEKHLLKFCTTLTNPKIPGVDGCNYYVRLPLRKPHARK